MDAQGLTEFLQECGLIALPPKDAGDDRGDEARLAAATQGMVQMLLGKVRTSRAKAGAEAPKPAGAEGEAGALLLNFTEWNALLVRLAYDRYTGVRGLANKVPLQPQFCVLACARSLALVTP